MKKKEILIIIGLFIFAIIGFFIFQLKPNDTNNPKINISYNNEVILSFDPTINDTYTFEGYIGEMVVEVKDGSWRMLSADCPNQICVNTGWVSLEASLTNPGIISCIPNHIVVAPE